MNSEISETHTAQLFITNYIRDLLVDLANDGGEDVDLEVMRDHFGQFADLVVEELGLVVTSFADDTAYAEFRPINGWS
jgi:hypothetical protein